MQGKLNIMKQKPDTGTFYAIRPLNGLGLFSRTLMGPMSTANTFFDS